MMVLQPVHAPKTCDNTTEYKIEYQKIEEKRESAVVYATNSRYKSTNQKILKQYPDPRGTNCVAYAKSRGAVPIGVGSLGQKLSKIKSKEPQKGKIGITREGPVGHMVVVEEVKEDSLIISEGNYRRGFITFREVPKSLIVGFL